MMWNYGIGHGGLGLLLAGTVILFLVVVPVVVILLAGRETAEPTVMANPGREPAEEELRTRFAAGQIDAAEYNARLTALRATERRG